MDAAHCFALKQIFAAALHKKTAQTDKERSVALAGYEASDTGAVIIATEKYKLLCELMAARMEMADYSTSAKKPTEVPLRFRMVSSAQNSLQLFKASAPEPIVEKDPVEPVEPVEPVVE